MGLLAVVKGEGMYRSCINYMRVTVAIKIIIPQLFGTYKLSRNMGQHLG